MRNVGSLTLKKGKHAGVLQQHRGLNDLHVCRDATTDWLEEREEKCS